MTLLSYDHYLYSSMMLQKWPFIQDLKLVFSSDFIGNACLVKLALLSCDELKDIFFEQENQSFYYVTEKLLIIWDIH